MESVPQIVLLAKHIRHRQDEMLQLSRAYRLHFSVVIQLMTEVKQNQGAGCPRQRTETGCHRQIRQPQAVWQQEGHYGVTHILHGEAGQSFKHGGAHFLYIVQSK